MPRKKKSKKELREELKKKRLAKLNKQIKEEPIIEETEEERVEEFGRLSEAIKENFTRKDEKYFIKTNDLVVDEGVFKREKDALQKEIDSFKDPEILEIPEFLTNPEKEEERKAVMERLMYLLKRRFSLVTIADILETNDYGKLEEIIERKDNVHRTIESYTGKDGQKPISLFSGLKLTVGDEYSSNYAEQERRIGAVINILSEGTPYFKRAASNRIEREISETAEAEKWSKKKIKEELAKVTPEMIEEKILDLTPEDIEIAIGDIVGEVIDSPAFNFACQIETEFVMHEVDKTLAVIEDLRSRGELQDVIEELKTIARTASERSHAYSVMEKLVTGKEKKIVQENTTKEEDER